MDLLEHVERMRDDIYKSRQERNDKWESNWAKARELERIVKAGDGIGHGFAREMVSILVDSLSDLGVAHTLAEVQSSLLVESVKSWKDGDPYE